jgi:hypothetical protein
MEFFAKQKRGKFQRMAFFARAEPRQKKGNGLANGEGSVQRMAFFAWALPRQKNGRSPPRCFFCKAKKRKIPFTFMIKHNFYFSIHYSTSLKGKISLSYFCKKMCVSISKENLQIQHHLSS